MINSKRLIPQQVRELIEETMAASAGLGGTIDADDVITCLNADLVDVAINDILVATGRQTPVAHLMSLTHEPGDRAI